MRKRKVSIDILKTNYDYSTDKKSTFPERINVKLKNGYVDEKTIGYVRG